ncbi:MAG: nickel-responsive transcriptional regulator NikR [Dongiaceae bacterium]
MERVTISLDEELLKEFDRYIAQKKYENRSEAIRDLLRERLQQTRLAGGKPSHAVGCLSYVYNHHQRQLPKRLTQSQHDHHDFILSTLHVHLDHEDCLEIVLLKGKASDLTRFAEATVAEPGVRHGRLNLVAADKVRGRHRHKGAPDETPHTHFSPSS